MPVQRHRFAGATPAEEEIPLKVWLPSLVVSSIAAMLALHFWFSMPAIEVALAVLLALLVAVLAVRALGDTDINPVSGIGKLTQAVFAAVAPGRVMSNLVAGAASEAAAQQAGDMMQDFKTAYLLGVSPRAQFVAMFIGSAVSCVVSTGAYLLYSAAYAVGDQDGKLPAPTAHIWIAMARLVTGEKLPPGAVAFCWAGGALGMLLGLLPELLSHLRTCCERSKGSAQWQVCIERAETWCPSGIGFAIGMYVLPVFVLPRVVGSIAEQVWLAVAQRSHREGMLVVASGLVLGEGIATLVVTLVRAFTGH